MANGVKTFAEFVQECETFQYSQENFDLIKQIGEISLMENYLERYDFLEEHGDEVQSLVTESYFGEAATESEYEMITEGVIQAIGNVIGKIISGIGKIFKSIGRFLGICGDKVEEQEAACQAILGGSGSGDLERTNNTKYKFTWTQDGIQRMDNLIQGIDSKVMIIPEKQKDGLKISFEKDKSVTADDATINRVSSALRSALAFGGVVVTLKSPSAPAAGPDDIIYVADSIGAGKKEDIDYNDIKNRLKSVDDVTKKLFAKANQKDSEVRFKVDAGYLKETGKRLGEAADAIQRAMNKIGSKKTDVDASQGVNVNAKNYQNTGLTSGQEAKGVDNKKGTRTTQQVVATNNQNGKSQEARDKAYRKDHNDVNYDSTALGSYRATYGQLNQIVGATIRVWNQYMAFRKATINAYGGGANGVGKLKEKGGGNIKAADIKAGSDKNDGLKDAKTSVADKSTPAAKAAANNNP